MTAAIGMMAAVGVLVLLVSCGGSDGGETVRVYTGRHYDLEPAFEAFSEQTGIGVEFLAGSDVELRERIEAEGDDTQADVYLTVDAANLALAAEEGLFRPLDSDTLVEAVPERYRAPGGEWFGLTRRVRTIVYAPDRVAPDEVPTTYAELADPVWEGRLCLRDSTNVYQQSLVASLISHEGRDRAVEIVEGWARNAELLPNDVLVLETIAAGGCDVGVTNHYYLARLLEDDPDFPVELVWADQAGPGVHVNVSGGGVTAAADDPEPARRLLEFLATEGQSAFVDGNHEYPVNPAVEAEPLIRDTFGTDFTEDDLNAGEIGALNAEAVAVMDEAGYR